MAEKKVYLMMKVTTPNHLIDEFHEFWGKESLPIWLRYGARHIGSFTNYVGGPVNEITRLFEFDSIAQWEQWEKFLLDSEDGKNLLQRLSKYIITVERKLLLSVY